MKVGQRSLYPNLIFYLKKLNECVPGRGSPASVVANVSAG